MLATQACSLIATAMHMSLTKTFHLEEYSVVGDLMRRVQRMMLLAAFYVHQRSIGL